MRTKNNYFAYSVKIYSFKRALKVHFRPQNSCNEEFQVQSYFIENQKAEKHRSTSRYLIDVYRQGYIYKFDVNFFKI